MWWVALTTERMSNEKGTSPDMGAGVVLDSGRVERVVFSTLGNRWKGADSAT